jgi:putative membrane protein
MIVRPRLTWYRMLFVWKGSVLHSLMAPLSIILLLSLIVTIDAVRGNDLRIHLNPMPFSLIGVALAIFVSFRNNVSYDRFWEARKLWGEMLNRARSAVRLAATMPQPAATPTEMRTTVDLLCAFIYALKHQLRGSDAARDLQRLLPPSVAADVLSRTYRPPHVLTLLARQATGWHRDGRIGDILLDALQTQFEQLTAIVGGCERIASTPIPYAYSVLLHRTTYFYCALLPFGLVETIGWATPLISVFIAYAFMALDAIASELENPFGEEPHDLPLAAIAVMIERTLREAIDEPMPPLAVPDEHFRLR